MSSAFKALLASKVRSNNGCWTCRCRRKKCSENRPACEECTSLEITCYFGDEKPDWMDSGPRQKEMAEKIKSQVKRQASQRRDKKYLDMLETGTRMVNLEGRDADKGKRPEKNDANMTGTTDTDPSSGQENGSTPPSSNTSGNSPPDVPWHSQLFPREEDPNGGPDVDIHFIMIYLDYVFPCLFPHYRPPVLVGGRGWMLDVLQSSKAVYHTAISLSSYFFSVVMAGGLKEHEECTNRMVSKVQVQLEMGLHELQKEVSAMNAHKGTSDIRASLVVMQSVLQMLTFEVATCSSGNWSMHLDAAIAMFLQILPLPDLWSDTLNSLYTPRWPPPEMGLERPWSTAQASLRFFTANLIYTDIMASITLSTAPRLYRYHANIMPGCRPKEPGMEMRRAGPLFMDEFIGLHNTVLQLLSDVSALDSWKKVQRRAGLLSTNELVKRGNILAESIKAAIDLTRSYFVCGGNPTTLTREAFSLVVQDPLPDLTRDPNDPHPLVAVHNVIWLQATLTYLYTVISGWQPSCPEIQTSVTHTKDLLLMAPSGMCLRALIFPLVISGCLSPQEDEQAFRDMVNRLGPLRVFGTVKEGSEIMERVWARRDQLDENWDVAKCLNILGHAVMLV